jgi:hypothetical protein
MSETHQPRQALQSVGALLAGMLTGIILFLGTDELLHLAHVFPPWDQRATDALLLLATIYRTIYGVAGSYVAARLAPNRRVLHAMILGVLGLAASTAGAVVTCNTDRLTPVTSSTPHPTAASKPLKTRPPAGPRIPPTESPSHSLPTTDHRPDG